MQDCSIPIANSLEILQSCTKPSKSDKWWGTHYIDVIMGTIASQITSLTIVFSTVYSDADQRKHQSSASLAFVQGIHRGPVNSPHKWPVTRKMFPFDDVIMWRACIVHPADSLVIPSMGVCNSLGLLQGAVWNHAKLSIPHRLGNLFNSLTSGVTKWSPRTCFYALSFMLNLSLGNENIFAFSIISQHRDGSYQWLNTGLQYLHCSCTGDTAVLH